MNNRSELSSLVQSAISIESPAERREFLNKSCGKNRGLMGRLQIVLDSLPDAEARPKAKAPAHQSVLYSIAGAENRVPQVCLDDSIESAPTPIVQPSSQESPKLSDHSRYQLHGEIARGGMGAILKGRDTDLGRSLAVKVLLDAHKDNELAVQRFVEEAQIGGQLQHPGIAPVYELGRFEDRRPFFTMKLVTGETLAWMLMTRRTPEQDRAKLLGIFEQMCRTMAYAHSRRVIHRDLKPANIMVGSFGEVQVMDWGLAKVLPKEGQRQEKPKALDPLKDQSIIQTVRSTEGHGKLPAQGIGTSGSAGTNTQMGSAMGTPAYMPPEQALGEVDQMDRRADVFGLGAILCEILTDEPPYVGDTTAEILRMAARAKLAPCMTRLDACGADATLIDLTKRCLSEEADERPADAGVLADEISAHLHSVEEKLHQTKVEQAQAAARTVEERKRRRVSLALAVSVLLMLCVGGGTWMQIQGQRRVQAAAANTKLDEAVNEAKLHQGLAMDQSLQVQDAELSKALISAKQAAELSQQDGVDAKKRDEVKTLLAVLQQNAKKVESDLQEQTQNQQILDRLDMIRVSHADGGKKLDVAKQDEAFAVERTNQQYRKLFHSAGLNIEQLEVKEAAEQIKKSAISEDLISALDSWSSAISAQSRLKQQGALYAAGEWASVVEIGKVRLLEDPNDSACWLSLAPALLLSGDLDGYRVHLREMMKRFENTKARHESLHVVKAGTLIPNAVELHPEIVQTLEKWLDEGQDHTYVMFPWSTRALMELRRGNLDLAAKFIAEALEHSGPKTTKAYALVVQAMVQHGLGQVDDAEQTLEQASTVVDALLADIRYRRSLDTPIAVLLLQEATALIHPDAAKIDIAKVYGGYSKQRSLESYSRSRLRDRLLQIANSTDENGWRKLLRRAIVSGDIESIVNAAEDPSVEEQSVAMVSWLARSLYHAKKYEPAVHILEKALQKEPTDFWLNYEISRSLSKLDRTDEALGYARAAFAIQPKSSATVWLVVANLHDTGKIEESMKVFRQWLSTSEMSVDELVSLSGDLRHRGRFVHAEAVARKAIETDPESSSAYQYLAYVLNDLERHDEEVQAAEKAVELDPDDRDMNFRLAYALRSAGELEKSIGAYRRVLEIDPTYAAAYNNLGSALRAHGDIEEAVEMNREAFRLAPRSHMYHQNLSLSLVVLANETGHPRELMDEITALRIRGPGPQGRIAEYRRTLELNPRDRDARRSLVRHLLEAGEYAEAEKECRFLIESEPPTGQMHVLLAWALRGQDKAENALAHYRKAMELAPDVWIPHLQFAAAAHAHAIGNRLLNEPGGGQIVPPQFHPDDLELTEEQAALLDEAIGAYRRFIELLESNARTQDTNSPQYSGPSNSVEIRRAPKQLEISASLALALALRARGRSEEAEVVEKKRGAALAAMEPRRRPSRRPGFTFLQKIAALKRRGDLDEAVEAMRQHLKDNEFNVPVAAELGQTLGRLGRNDEAVDVFESIIESRPDVSGGYEGLGKLYAFNEPRRPDKAIEAFDRGIAAGLAEPQIAFLQMMKGSVYLSEERWEPALDAYNQALKLNPKMGLAYSGIGEVRMRQGKVDEALKALRKSVGLSPQDGTCHRSLAKALISVVDDKGQYPNIDEALKHALQAVDTFRFSSVAGSPPSAWLHTVGLIYYRKGDFPQALKHLQKANEEGFDSVKNSTLTAMTHWQLGDREEARSLYDRLEIDTRDLTDEEKNLLSEAAKLIMP